jgi:hypothetical protein
MDGPLSDKLRVYFGELGAGGRLMFATALAKAGDSLPHADMILGALKGVMREKGELPAEDLAALVMEPCQPFVVAATKLTKTPGVILEGSIDKVWRWLEQGPGATAIGKLRAAIEADLLGRVSPEAIQAARNTCARAIADTVKAATEERQGTARLVSQLGDERAVEDLEDIGAALRYGGLLDDFAADLDSDLKLPADEILPAVRQHLNVILKKAKPAHPLALHLLKKRLGNSAALIRFLVAIGATSNAGLLFDSPYGPLLSFVLSDAERAVGRAQEARSNPDSRELVLAIRNLGGALRAIEAEVIFDSRSAPARRITGFRKAMSEVLTSRLSDLTQRAKQLVRPKADPKRGPTSPDMHEVDRIDADIAVLMAARNYAEDLAIKAETLRVFSEIKDLLDTGAPLLIDRLRSLPMGERAPVRERLDAVARISKRLLGNEYAGLLIKAVHVADAPPPEKKAANG